MIDDLKQKCFVVMSFSTNRKSVYDEGIKPTVESLGINCYRVDEMAFTTAILQEIQNSIEQSYFVVADISEERPNCYYEIGVAHALGRPVILTKDHMSKTHFDLSGFSVIEYRSPEDLSILLKERIIGSILTLKTETDYEDENRGHFGLMAFKKCKLLTALIIRANSKKWFKVRASVFSVDPKKSPLKGTVKFFLHSSYDPKKRLVKVKNGVATVEVDAYGAYTIGARLDQDHTELELDLKTIPGGSRRFYER
jgi:hypothetical protein